MKKQYLFLKLLVIFYLLIFNNCFAQDMEISTPGANNGRIGTYRDPATGDIITTIIAPRNNNQGNNYPVFISPQVYPQYYPPYYPYQHDNNNNYRPNHDDHRPPPMPPNHDDHRPPHTYPNGNPPMPPYHGGNEMNNGPRPPFGAGTGMNPSILPNRN